MNIPSAERALTHPFFTGKQCTRLQGEKAAWDIFLSYRVASDSHHVEMLYDALTAKGLKVWWDKKCLLPGKDWEEGFCNGLVNSETFVCLLSRNAIKHSSKDWQNFEKLQRTSPCDNVLLEWHLALELRERGMISGIYPVMIGDKDLEEQYSNYFTSGYNPSAAPAVAIDSVETKFGERLDREGLGFPYKKSDTVSGVLGAILANQGGFIQGDLNTAMCIVVEKIVDMAAPRNLVDSKEITEIEQLKIDIPMLKAEIEALR
eukprot:gene14762-biopygen7665